MEDDLKKRLFECKSCGHKKMIASVPTKEAWDFCPQCSGEGDVVGKESKFMPHSGRTYRRFRYVGDSSGPVEEKSSFFADFSI